MNGEAPLKLLVVEDRTADAELAEMTLEAEPGTGTAFHVELPIAGPPSLRSTEG